MATKKTIKVVVILLIMAALAFAVTNRVERNKEQEQMPAAQALPVKAVKVITRDTVIVTSYAGQVKAIDEVAVQSRVGGSVVEKYVQGGELVKRGQSLFKIDTRQYTSALLTAQGELAQAEALLANSRRDTQRYTRLLSEDAIAEQQVTTQIAQEKSDLAVVNAKRSIVQQAKNDLDDTTVYSPIDGRLNLNDVAVGTYSVAGSTPLVTVGTLDPMFVQFNMSETDYLEAMRYYQEKSMDQMWGKKLEFSLSDGSKYPHVGEVSQIDRGLGDNSGTLSIKATVKNPGGILIPDMFVRVKADATELKGAILIPQRAVQQLLDRSFVMIVGEGNKAEVKTVDLSRKIGSFWIVRKGLSGDETIVVEGLTKIQEGVPLAVTMTTPEELKLSFEDNMTDIVQ